GRGAGPAHRGRWRSQGARAARGGGGLSSAEGRPGERRADGARGRAGHAPSAAYPENARRQALRQDPGDHRAAAGGQPLHRRDATRRRAQAMKRLLAVLALIAPLLAKAQGFAIVVQDDTALRPLAGSSARPLALLAQGETLEVRGERLDYLAVWDYARERGGFVRATQVRRLALTADEAPELLAVLRFLRGVPGAEPLGIAIGAAYIEAAPAERLNGAEGVEALEALGAMAERMARKPSRHVEVMARYGVRFVTVPANGRVRLCYDGTVHRKILALQASEEQRARALLAL